MTNYSSTSNKTFSPTHKQSKKILTKEITYYRKNLKAIKRPTMSVFKINIFLFYNSQNKILDKTNQLDDT